MAIRLVLAIILVASCSKTGLTMDSGTRHDSAAQDSVGADRLLVTRDLPGAEEVGADSLLVTRDVLGAEANLGCEGTFTGQCDDDCGFPTYWTSAQNLSRWCGLYQVFPPTSLALCPDTDGYNRAVVFYETGGEMLVIDRLFFLYDSTTGAFVQEQFDPWRGRGGEASCVLGLPGQTLHWSSACALLGASLDSVCSKGLPDAG
jgi:hypothetical protein